MREGNVFTGVCPFVGGTHANWSRSLVPGPFPGGYPLVLSLVLSGVKAVPLVPNPFLGVGGGTTFRP